MEFGSGSGRLPLVAGLHIDDFNKIRVFQPDAEQRSSELLDGCREFAEKTDEFRQLASELLSLSERLATDVEMQKLKAIGCRNALRNLDKEKAAKRQQLAALIHEKKSQLERLHIQYSSLVKVETEQNEFVDQFVLHK